MLALAAPLLAAGCTSDHHVSPWGSADRPRISAFVERPDLNAQIARIDAETAPLGLRLVTEIQVELPRGAGPARIRGYEGEDAVGRRTHAVRVATARGVVMALGPLDLHDSLRDLADELVPALVQPEGDSAGAGAFRSATDLNGDDALDVVVRSKSGRIEIWAITPLGADRYAIEMAAPPTRALELDGDGRIDLAGEVPIDQDDPIAPHLTDVATFARGRYKNTTPAARAFHARLAAPAPPAAPPREEARLAGVIERAFHAVLSGKPKEAVLRELAREPVPPAYRASFERHTQRIAALKD